jgi:hypothetical protein
MRTLILALLGAGFVIAQTDTNSVIDAYQRGVQFANQQYAILVECLSHPSCAAAMQEAQARREQAKADKERQKTEIKLAKLRLKLERELAKGRTTSGLVGSALP